MVAAASFVRERLRSKLVATRDRDFCYLDALAEANDQFHWGTKDEEVEQSARRLRTLGVNPALAGELEAKAAHMKNVCRYGSGLEGPSATS